MSLVTCVSAAFKERAQRGRVVENANGFKTFTKAVFAGAQSADQDQNVALAQYLAKELFGKGIANTTPYIATIREGFQYGFAHPEYAISVEWEAVYALGCARKWTEEVRSWRL